MSNKRILIVDDEERIREVVRACLEDLGGWETIVAESGEEGLLKAESEAFDAILLDVSMPDLDGFTFFQRLQDNIKARSLPVILLTAKVLSSDRDRFSRMGVAGVITKPFNPVTLAEQIAAILGWNIE
ncbi:MAG: response regulator [Hydrococcus sp. Prado102]|jgi:CheY-like chemotaxis protein|nr:response regulator [Hydrococcus sp. Prado102]